LFAKHASNVPDSSGNRDNFSEADFPEEILKPFFRGKRELSYYGLRNL